MLDHPGAIQVPTGALKWPKTALKWPRMAQNHHNGSHQLSLQKFLELETLGPIDRTRETWVRLKYRSLKSSKSFTGRRRLGRRQVRGTYWDVSLWPGDIITFSGNLKFFKTSELFLGNLNIFKKKSEHFHEEIHLKSFTGWRRLGRRPFQAL